MRIVPAATLVLFIAIYSPCEAKADGRGSGPDPGQQCRTAIRAAERAAGIPEHLMSAIGQVESGRRGPDGVITPWPWSINAEGTDFVFETKQAVIAAVRALQAKGMHSIDVGCMQVNLMYHPQAFATLEQAFDPVENARYAARFLLELKAQTGAWDKATAWYHSATPGLGEPYQRRVMAVMPEEKKRGETEALHSNLLAAWNATLRPQPGGDNTMVNRPPSFRPLTATTVGRGTGAYRTTAIPLPARPSVRTQL